MPPGELTAPAGSQPFEATVLAPLSPGEPYLIGGVIKAPTPAAQGFRPVAPLQVAVWVSPSAKGPWRLADFRDDPQRDGPNETITYLATSRSNTVGFGWRNSPTEGYPRPSAWVASSGDRTWTEVIEDREFFGGPNIVGYGGMTAGPHGDFIAGTWTDGRGHPVLSVWSSPNGSSWSQNFTDPAFEGEPGELPYGAGVGDSSSGVLVVGTLEVPTHANPSARRGAIWFSPDGKAWSRTLAGVIARSYPLSTFGAVGALPAGWIIAGTVGPSATARPFAWSVGPDGKRLTPVSLPGSDRRGSVDLTAVAANRAQVAIAGSDDGRPVIWSAPLSGGRPGSWREVLGPPAPPWPVQRVVISAGATSTMVDLVGQSDAQVWVAPTTSF